jgi:hypothetical protein
MSIKEFHLLIIIISILVDNVEEAQFIDALAGADHPQPIAQLLFLEELLRQVLQVSPAEGDMRHNLDLAIADTLDFDLVAEVAGAAFDLDAVVQELLEGGEVEDLV